MKKLILASAAALALFAAPAVASDLPNKAPRTMGSVQMPWTGFYAGIDGGYGWGDTSTGLSFGPAFSLGSNPKPAGATLGGHIGALYQFQSGWVVGVEASLMKTWMDDTSPVSGLPAGISANVKADDKYLGLVDAKLGYGTQDWLFYVTGGAAWKRSDLSVSVAGLGSATSDKYDTNGWTLGAGVDYKFAPNWTLGLDYHYINWNDSNAAFKFGGGLGGAGLSLPVNNDPEHLIRAKLSYLFGS